jgi:hypothetical protein
MSKIDEIVAELQGVGISEHDALVIADCIVTRKSCSWVNTDPVDEKLLRDLHNLIAKQGYKIKVVIEPIPTRAKFIWEVKVEQT